jgi:hypothetical protein
MRDEAFVRDEIQWLVERARIALGLPESALAGCTDEQIAQIIEAQEVSELPPPLDAVPFAWTPATRSSSSSASSSVVPRSAGT